MGGEKDIVNAPELTKTQLKRDAGCSPTALWMRCMDTPGSGSDERGTRQLGRPRLEWFQVG